MNRWRKWVKTLYGVLRPGQHSGHTAFARRRGPVTHVLILDGTMSSLSEGCESNAGLTYKLLSETAGSAVSLYYEAGLQWYDWRTTPNVMMGRGLNRQIRRAYGYLASRYRPGDRIFLFGYSRGAFAVRSLAGVIDKIGLLRAEEATERNVRTAYRHYQCRPDSEAGKAFTHAYCHTSVKIEMVGVWDTVKALGMRIPILWRFRADAHGFHNHHLGPTTKHGFHALALDETRNAYAPVLWNCPPGFEGHVEQVWFRGSHGDVGGQLDGFHAARPLSNIPLVWMLEQAVGCGLRLPEGWRGRFKVDIAAPSVGSWHGWGKIFLLRSARVVGADPSERLHESVEGRKVSWKGGARAMVAMKDGGGA
ncbi:Uncharacterized protein, PA2063/DUF2235 family [Roseovarius marisflavi]|uniref:Uncharacterized protein, PA2063/DUF2235 family n=1 Tax=Roseovarius marisflavi TaxID=1054996 RepID=A0A1M6W6H7_9RHOB|nr:DUF2235 domain-containing protein [Roseovarius marisflavi]SHK89392.1 Uncharacterized protein, PA2063/DUF2235 family [Roseovarius marisflavi]